MSDAGDFPEGVKRSPAPGRNWRDMRRSMAAYLRLSPEERQARREQRAACRVDAGVKNAQRASNEHTG